MLDDGTIAALLLADDGYGANWLIEDGKPSIQRAFVSFGWLVRTASPAGRVDPCPWAAARGFGPIATDYRVSDLEVPAPWDAVVVLPGCGHGGLAADGAALELLRRADAAGIAVAAFCRGVRVLAAAGILRGRRVAGHMDCAAGCAAAGARFAAYADLAGKSDAPPPVVDGNLVTGARSDFYRMEMCAALRDLVLARAGRAGEPDASGERRVAR